MIIINATTLLRTPAPTELSAEELLDTDDGPSFYLTTTTLAPHTQNVYSVDSGFEDDDQASTEFTLDSLFDSSSSSEDHISPSIIQSIQTTTTSNMDVGSSILPSSNRYEQIMNIIKEIICDVGKEMDTFAILLLVASLLIVFIGILAIICQCKMWKRSKKIRNFETSSWLEYKLDRTKLSSSTLKVDHVNENRLDDNFQSNNNNNNNNGSSETSSIRKTTSKCSSMDHFLQRRLSPPILQSTTASAASSQQTYEDKYKQLMITFLWNHKASSANHSMDNPFQNTISSSKPVFLGFDDNYPTKKLPSFRSHSINNLASNQFVSNSTLKTLEQKKKTSKSTKKSSTKNHRKRSLGRLLFGKKSRHYHPNKSSSSGSDTQPFFRSNSRSTPQSDLSTGPEGFLNSGPTTTTRCSSVHSYTSSRDYETQTVEMNLTGSEGDGDSLKDSKTITKSSDGTKLRKTAEKVVVRRADRKNSLETNTTVASNIVQKPYRQRQRKATTSAHLKVPPITNSNKILLRMNSMSALNELARRMQTSNCPTGQDCCQFENFITKNPLYMECNNGNCNNNLDWPELNFPFVNNSSTLLTSAKNALARKYSPNRTRTHQHFPPLPTPPGVANGGFYPLRQRSQSYHHLPDTCCHPMY